MGQRKPLSTPKAAKFKAKISLWMALMGARPLRRPRPPTPHWCHIPPALFPSGKGLCLQFESSNAVARTLASRKPARQRGEAFVDTGLGLGVGRGATAAAV